MRRWYAQHRQDWIAEMLRIYGFINQKHLMRKFGVSAPQASHDLNVYRRENPGTITYNLTTKRYEAVE